MGSQSQSLQQRPMEGDEHYSEESCRDFIIYELGHLYGIPQGFRYAQGIDQVRTRLMLRYGDANLDRAMGIFNEILEDDSTTGLGDEGDVWRSWRHSYLHCHADLSNPGTPRFSGLVLPQPKPRASRATKTDSRSKKLATFQMENVPEVPETENPEETGGQSIPIVLDWDDGQQYSSLNSPNSPDGREQRLQLAVRENAIFEPKIDFEARVIKAMGSKDVTYDLLRRRAPPPNLQKIGLTKAFKRSVSTFFHTDRKTTNRVSLDLGGSHRKEEKRKMSLAIPCKPPFVNNVLDRVAEKVQFRPSDVTTLPSTTSVSSSNPVTTGSESGTTVRSKQNNNITENIPPVKRRIQLYLHSQTLGIMDASPHPPRTSSEGSSMRNTPKSPLNMQDVQASKSSPSLCKTSFDPITYSFLRPTTPASTHKRKVSVDPKKYTPPPPRGQDEARVQRQALYENILNSNPYDHDQLYPRSPSSYRTASIKSSHPSAYSYAEKPISVPSMMSYSSFSGSGSPFRSSPPPVPSKDDTTQTPLPSSQRGRTFSRSPSPTKVLEDLKEDEALLLPETPSHRPRSPMKKMFGDNGWLSRDPEPTSASPVKRSRSPIKRIFGDNGWLGRSTSMKELPSDIERKHGIKSWSDKLIQRVGDLGVREESQRCLFDHNNFDDDELPCPCSFQTVYRYPISIDPLNQSNIYAEVELMLCVSANQYLKLQEQKARLSADSVARTVAWWKSKNRPHVIEYLFDQQTQQDLVAQNIKTVRFYGPNAQNPMYIAAMMSGWKSMAKEMSVRTFCAPDSVIRKQMHDTYKVLEMLGAASVTFLAFQNIHLKVLHLMREGQIRREIFDNLEPPDEAPSAFGVRGTSPSIHEPYFNQGNYD